MVSGVIESGLIIQPNQHREGARDERLRSSNMRYKFAIKSPVCFLTRQKIIWSRQPRHDWWLQGLFWMSVGTLWLITALSHRSDNKESMTNPCFHFIIYCMAIVSSLCPSDATFHDRSGSAYRVGSGNSLGTGSVLPAKFQSNWKL